jgi:hypothetical protein
VNAFDQSLFVAASCGQFSWETENAIRGGERRGGEKGNNQNKRGVEGVEGRRRIGGPVSVADPLRWTSSSEAVASTRLYARGVANGELERCGLPPSGGE